MKHQYTDEELQAAIDGAMARKTGDAYYAARPDIAVKSWGMESPARLAILRAALEALPEPASQPSLPLYTPDRKPTAEDACNDEIIIWWHSSTDGKLMCSQWDWNTPFEGDEVAWAPARLPAGFPPKVDQEAEWRKEFEEWLDSDGENCHRTESGQRAQMAAYLAACRRRAGKEGRSHE